MPPAPPGPGRPNAGSRTPAPEQSKTNMAGCSTHASRSVILSGMYCVYRWLNTHSSREMVGRVLKDLEEQGLVTASGKTMVVYGTR